MRYQDITKKKQRIIRLLWTLSILLLGLALSGWLSPVGAEVTLCGKTLEPVRDGFYRLRGQLTCSFVEQGVEEILYIDEEGAKFDLGRFRANGDGKINGILIEADDVIIEGGTFKNCDTALNVYKSDRCEIEKFKAIDSSGNAITIRGNDNSIVKSLCLKAGEDCFQLRGDGIIAEWNTAIWHGTIGKGQGIQLRGQGYARKCSVFGGGGEGFQIHEDSSDVTIERCLAINNDKGGIEVKELKEDATGNTIKHNIAFANGDGINSFDLIDANDNCRVCDLLNNCIYNNWIENKFRSSNQPCIK